MFHTHRESVSVVFPVTSVAELVTSVVLAIPPVLVWLVEIFVRERKRERIHNNLRRNPYKLCHHGS